jgi:hypothetical protein
MTHYLVSQDWQCSKFWTVSTQEVRACGEPWNTDLHTFGLHKTAKDARAAVEFVLHGALTPWKRQTGAGAAWYIAEGKE